LSLRLFITLLSERYGAHRVVGVELSDGSFDGVLKRLVAVKWACALAALVVGFYQDRLSILQKEGGASAVARDEHFTVAGLLLRVDFEKDLVIDDRGNGVHKDATVLVS